MSQTATVTFETDSTDVEKLVETLNQRVSGAGLNVRNIQLVTATDEVVEADTHAVTITLATEHGAVSGDQLLAAVNRAISFTPPLVVKPAVKAYVTDIQLAAVPTNQD